MTCPIWRWILAESKDREMRERKESIDNRVDSYYCVCKFKSSMLLATIPLISIDKEITYA